MRIGGARRVAALLLLLPTVGWASPPGATVDLGATDARVITHEPRGEALRAEVARDWTARGVDTEPSELTVLALDGGGILVTRDPEGVRTDGRTMWRTVAGGTEESPAATRGKPYWQWKWRDCFDTFIREGGRIDNCASSFRLVGDGSSTYDYRTLHHYGTAGNHVASGDGNLDVAQIRSDSHSSGDEWVDWSPRSDFTGACGGFEVGVSYAGVEIAWDVVRCETWDMWKGDSANDGDYWLAYRHPQPGIRAEREVDYATMIRVYQDYSPLYTISWWTG